MGVGVCESRGVGELQCGGVVMCGSHGVGESQCVGGRGGYQTLIYCVFGFL